MSMAEAASEGARVHWLVAGVFTAAPDGARIKVTPDTFAQAMVDAKLNVTVSVRDRLGNGDSRSFDVSFTRPKSFQLTELIASIPVLAGLRALGEDLGSTDASRRPAADAAVARVTELVGPGKLAEAVTAAVSPASATPKADGPAGTGDGIFDKADVSKGPTGAGAIDAFVRAIRPTSGTAAPATGTSSAKAARAVIEEAVFGTAGDILRDVAVARIEHAWRGLKLVVDQCASNAGMALEAVDTTVANADAAIQAAIADDTIDQPDAIFLVEDVDDPARLATLASLAEGLNVPLVVGVSHAFFGVADPGAVSTKIEDENGGLPEAYSALRQDESSRWLALATNRMVLAADGTGAARRVTFGSPVFAVAAMLAASYRTTGSFARILGQPGSLKAPGTVELTTGREAGNAVPTEAFTSLRAQARLTALGIIGLGSGRNTDMVALSNAPMVRAGADVVPLSAQILTGRIVRFAQWVRDQLPQGAEDKDVVALFEQAAGVFLFPGAAEQAGLKAQIATNKDGRGVLVSASVRAELAGLPFHLGFTLPLAR